MDVASLAVVAALLLAQEGAPPGSPAPPLPVRRALLIGINDYRMDDTRPDPPFRDLQGAANDVELLREVLGKRFGFAPEHVRVLLDRAATREAILEALRALVAESRPQDVVYVHFSGHGSQARDQDGDEPDGFDETILPHDARLPGIADITDDALGEILGGLSAASALVVLDSCHSGTATRGASVRTRSVPPDTRSELYRRPEGVARRSAAAPRYVLMTGAGEHQSALDGPVDGNYYGFFSYALGRSLGSAEDGATPRDVHAGVMQVFAQFAARYSQIAMPEPQLEAPAELLARPVLRGPEPPPAPPPRLPFAEGFPEGEGVRLARARALGAAPGTLWALYPPGETAFAPGGAHAMAEVVALRGEDALARVTPAGIAVPAGCRAVRVGSAATGGKQLPAVRLDRVQGEARGPLTEALAAAGVPLAGAGEPAALLVDVQEGDCQVYDPTGVQRIASFPAAPAERAARRIGGLARRAAVLAELAGLDNPGSGLALDLRVLPTGAGGGIRSVAVAAAGDVPAYAIRGESPRSPANSLTVEVAAGSDLHLTLLDVDMEGKVTVLFPNALSEERGFLPGGFLRAGTRARIPDALGETNAAGFFWDVTPPAGVDTIVAFAASDAETARAFRDRVTGLQGRGIAREVATRGIAVVAAPASTPRAEEAAAAPAPARKPGSDWALRTVTFLVEEAP